jgi:hypothetical protein
MNPSVVFSIEDSGAAEVALTITAVTTVLQHGQT